VDCSRQKKNTDVFVSFLHDRWHCGELSNCCFDAAGSLSHRPASGSASWKGLSHELDFVTNVGNDRTQLLSMGQKALDATGWQELTVLADRGYYNGDEVWPARDQVLPSTGTTGHPERCLDPPRFCVLTSRWQHRAYTE
jgi:hypothetical protein